MSNTCGLTEVVIFLSALLSGTIRSVASKVMLGLQAESLSGDLQPFEYPLFQTFFMFAGMSGALLMHYAVVYFKIPVPGYNHSTRNGYTTIPPNTPTGNNLSDFPLWMHLVLIIPSACDLASTGLSMFGLLWVDVSVYQMLRGAAIIFVAIIKQFIMGDKLKGYMWVGISWNVAAIALVGLTAMFSSHEDQLKQGSTEDNGGSKAMLGVFLILLGSVCQAAQYTFEEYLLVASVESERTVPPIPPLLLIGMEGLWGSILCLFVLYPVLYAIPGNDFGSLENPFNAVHMITHSTSIQVTFFVFFFSTLAYNVLGILITFMLSSVWHAILDNFTPITVWALDIFIFYAVTRTFGEHWSSWSWMQLVGLLMLFYGTAVYNAPFQGSIKLTGSWLSCLFDFTEEYELIELELMLLEDTLRREGLLDDEESPQVSLPSVLRTPLLRSVPPSPFLGAHSPFMLTPGSSAAQHRGMRPRRQSDSDSRFPLNKSSYQRANSHVGVVPGSLDKNTLMRIVEERQRPSKREIELRKA